jgi:hypothetical protein
MHIDGRGYKTYIFNTDVLANYLLKDSLETNSSHDFIPRVIQNEKIFAYKFDSYWQGIITPEASSLPRSEKKARLLSVLAVVRTRVKRKVMGNTSAPDQKLINKFINPIFHAILRAQNAKSSG